MQQNRGSFSTHSTLGRVILLNGPSSAGKSSLAKALQRLIPEGTMLFSMDDYLAMSSGKHTTALEAVKESGLPFIESLPRLHSRSSP